MTKFAIVGTQRTGTSLIRTMLDSHPEVFAIEEAFHMKWLNDLGYAKYIESSFSRKMKHYFMRKDNIFRYLDELYSLSNFSAVGFKIHYSHIKQFPMVADCLSKNRINIIHVVRSNVLKTLLSRKMAKQTKIYHSHQKIPVSKIHIPKFRLFYYLKKISQENKQLELLFSNSSSPYIQVNYETVTANLNDEGKKLLSFLNVNTSIPISSQLIKINPNNIEDIVINYDELKNWLKGSEFEWCLS